MTKIINTLEDLPLADKNAVKTYWKSDLLQKLYFLPKKVNEPECERKLQNEAYLQLLRETAAFLERHAASDICENMLAQFERDTGVTLEDETVYIILGCDTTTIYSVTLRSETVSVLCVEAIHGDVRRLRMLLAHEYTHFARRQCLKEDIFESCIGERLVTEGIAESYSKEQVPDLPDELYCIVSKETVEWTRANMAKLEEYIKERLSDNTLMESLFYMFADIDFPIRTGYVYGFFAVQKYLKANGAVVRDILVEDWHEILRSILRD